jgi:cytochrome c-type biogenesis protein CcmH/NrfG
MRRYCCIIGVCAANGVSGFMAAYFTRSVGRLNYFCGNNELRFAGITGAAWYDQQMTFHFSLATPRHLLVGVVAALCLGCTPQQMLIQALIPDGTASMLLSHLQTVEDGNRRHIAEMEQKGDWAGLTRFADTNIATDPFSPEWRMIGGYAQLQLRDYAKATAYFSEMVRLAPDDATGYHFLAETQRAAGQPQRAVTTLERALLVVRESPLTHQLLGEAYSDLGRFRPAAEAYRRALAIDPLLADAWFGAGRASLQLGRAADARDALDELERLRSPRAADLRTLLVKGK